MAHRLPDHPAPETYYAHSRPDCAEADWERLEPHLRRTAALARRFARRFGLGATAAASGLLHDVGKYAPAFQARLRGGGKVDHATAGAREALRLYEQRVGHLLTYGIAGHHGGLPDGGEGDGGLLERLRRPGQLPDGIRPWEGRIVLPKKQALIEEVTAWSRAGSSDGPFTAAFLARMIFSCLVDADFLATERIVDRGRARARPRLPGAAALAPVLAAYLARRFPPDPSRPIDRRRAEILAACRDAAGADPGVFTLCVPTGGGKTLASLAFALEHAARHGLDRVIYAIPYTSIIEQTADVFREALAELGPDVVVEHHSAAEVPARTRDEPTGPGRLHLATENWDAPLVVTTTVQLFDSLYANRPSRCRKLHNLARSVIVLDEVQALPLDRLAPCLAALRELVLRYGASVVLCSATIPAFDSHHALRVKLPPSRAIVPPAPEEAFRRVHGEIRCAPVDDATLAAELAAARQVLCIVDARRHAAELFRLLPDDGSRFHLSAALCPADRRRILATVKTRLDNRLPCRLIATRVIEAGVDISFPEVRRALAGIDSLAQAAGRCNRHGELPERGRFVVFESARPDAIPTNLVDLKRRAQTARDVLHDHPDPLDPQAIQAFFDRMIKDEASGEDGGQDRDQCWWRLHRSAPAMFPFRTVAELFRMVPDDTRPLIIAIDPMAAALVEALEKALDRKQAGITRLPLDLLRRIQAYTVGCYGLQRMVEAGNARSLDPDGRFHVLSNPALYDPEIGLSPDPAAPRDPASNIL
jgi:CRISPR-associated endonuclease/helicase Cas3